MADPAFISGNGAVGIAWPWSPSGPQAAYGIELVESKIGVVVLTFVGIHKMEPSFGSTVLALVFENRGPVLRTAASIEIKNALTTWVPDIEVDLVKVTDDPDVEGGVIIDVDYTYLGQPNTWTQPVSPPAGGGV